DRVQAERSPVQHLPQVARHPAIRAAAPARPRAARGTSDAPARALEARVRRLALPEVSDRAPSAAAGLRQVRRRRPDAGRALRGPLEPDRDPPAPPPPLLPP